MFKNDYFGHLLKTDYKRVRKQGNCLGCCFHNPGVDEHGLCQNASSRNNAQSDSGLCCEPSFLGLNQCTVIKQKALMSGREKDRVQEWLEISFLNLPCLQRASRQVFRKYRLLDMFPVHLIQGNSLSLDQEFRHQHFVQILPKTGDIL